jgi:hypothetical protein
MTTKQFTALLCLLLAANCHAQSRSGLACQVASFDGSLVQGQELDRDIGSGPLLRIWPTPMGKVVRDEGWFIDIVSREQPADEYLNFVNEPIRDINNRVLGPGRNADTGKRNTAEESLSHPREMRFILTKSDYDRLSAESEKARFSEGSPEVFAEALKRQQALRELADSIPTGLFTFRILSYEVDPTTGYPLNIKFAAQLTAPKAFRFARRLNPSPGPCEPSR